MAKENNKTEKNKTEEKKTNKVEKTVVKEKPKKERKVVNDDKVSDILKNIDDNRVPIILFVVGFLIATLLFRCILWPDRIATLKDGTQPVVNLKDDVVTADDLYETMKKRYSIDLLLNKVDDIILSKKYTEDDEMKKSIQETAEYYYNVYEKSYGYSKEQFLSQYGFNSEADFLENLRLDYLKNKYFEEYVVDSITDKEVQKYYDDEVFGDVDSKHILVSVKGDDDKEGLSDEEAKNLANEIIGKLNGGTSWDDVVSEYKDRTINEELGYKAFNASLEEAYIKEMKDLAVDTYSKTPVKTSYGYHVVYKIAQKDKPELKDVEEDIKDVIAANKKKDDNNLYYKALIKMREDAGVEFTDTKLAEEYEKYIKEYK